MCWSVGSTMLLLLAFPPPPLLFLWLQLSSRLILRTVKYSSLELRCLSHPGRLPLDAYISLRSSGLLRRRPYLHRSSKVKRTLHYSVGCNIPSLWTTSRPSVLTHHHRPISYGYLRTFLFTDLPKTAPSKFSFALLNTRSLNNKALPLCQFILDNHLDFLALCETWQQPGDFFALNQVAPSNYHYICKPRLSGRGGGLAVIYNKNVTVTPINLISVNSFEYIAFKACYSTVIIVLYRPPKPNVSFISEFSELLTVASTISLRLLVLGDFNIHMDSPNLKLSSDLADVLDCFNITQHVTFPTHTKGHILDLVCSTGLTISQVFPSPFPLSDHSIIQFTLHSKSIRIPQTRSISFRNIKAVNPLSLSDIIGAALNPELATISPDQLADLLYTTLSSSLNTLAPLKTKPVSFTSSSPWFNSELRKMKQTGRRLERLCSKTGLTVHLQSLHLHMCSYRDALTAARSSYFSSIINAPNSNARTLFSTVSKIIQPRRDTTCSSTQLANRFLQYFNDKIFNIYSSLKSKPPSATLSTGVGDFLLPTSDNHFSSFSLIDPTHVSKIIMASKHTTCSLDPLPTALCISCLPTLLPHLTKLFNLSLSQGIFPSVFKTASVTPILKKPGLETSILENYRPISNLPFFAKTLERIIASQLQHFLSANNLFEPLQSGFRTLHSTETALIKVTNDLLISADAGALNILILLDLSAAFDTVCHTLLLSRLHSLGVEGTALSLLQSYLTNRHNFISLNGFTSDMSPVTQGVPQGSVLGPLLFIVYILPLGQIIRHFNFNFHCYADDTQIYISTTSLKNPPLICIEQCLATINHWMQDNYLKLNSNKTELLLIGSKHTLTKAGNISLSIDGFTVSPSPLARNLGVLMDSTLSFNAHINNMVKISFFHLKNIAKIRPSLSQSAAAKLIHSFIFSRLDYCNSLLFGISASSLHKLQLVQNSAARLLTSTKSSEHISPVLVNLHWLPVSQRITYKILLLTYKALHNLAPPYLTELLQPYHPSRTLRSASDRQLVIPKIKLKHFGERAFSWAAPKLWNSLPPSIRNSSSLLIFQTNLKTYLFTLAYPS